MPEKIDDIIRPHDAKAAKVTCQKLQRATARVGRGQGGGAGRKGKRTIKPCTAGIILLDPQ